MGEERRAPRTAIGTSVSPGGPARAWLATLQRAAIRSLLPIGVICFALSLPYNVTGDGAIRFYDLQALLEHGTLSPGRYSLIGPLFATPLYLLGRALSSAEAGVAFFNLAVFLLGLVALRGLLRPWLDERTLRVFLLLLLVGSMFPAHVATFYGETFTAILVAVGLTAAVVARRAGGRRAGWVAVALGVANTPATLVGLGLALLQRLWRTRRLRYALVGVGAGALIVGESLLRRGSLVATAYVGDRGPVTLLPFSGRPGFSYPFFFGVLAIVLSFGKGLLFYTPGLFLPLRRRLAALGDAGAPLGTLYGLWLLFVAGLVLVYAPWWGWNGDWFWGPRFFLFASIPAAFALALWTQRPSARLWVNLLALAVLLLSLWVGIDAAAFGLADLQVCAVNHYQQLPLCQYTPEYSALWHPLVNVYLLGFGRQFAAVELWSPRSWLFITFALGAGLYIAWPLLRTLGAQARALLPGRAALWATLRAGWRW